MLLAAGIVAAFVCGHVPQALGYFEAPVLIDIGSGPESVVSADFNGDGNQDVASANYFSDEVSVLIGAGTGSFAAFTDFPAGDGPESVTAADFNGDGNKDLATANSNSDNLSVLLGTGTGTFAAPTSFPVSVEPEAVTSADFNGDGNPDLASANAWPSNNLSVLLGDGTGSFGTAASFPAGNYPLSLTSADFNGDGNKDLASGNWGGDNLSVLLGTGTGSFGTATNFSVGSDPLSLISADFNGDNKQDLVSSNSVSDNLSVLLGTGTGGFGTATNFPVGDQPTGVISADFNGDGIQDLATANRDSRNISVLTGAGTGSFNAATNFPTADFPLGAGPESVTSADFNKDGKQDVAAAIFGFDSLSVLLSDTTRPDTQLDSGPTGPTNNNDPSFAFSSTEDGSSFECRLDGPGAATGSFVSCTSPKPYTNLTDGEYTFHVTATDGAGNTDQTPASRSFTVDTEAPDTQIDSGPTGTITTNQATFTFAGDAAADTARIQCRIDSEPFADCTSPETFTGLTDGPHTAEFRAEDAAGNQDPTSATGSFTVDTTVYRARISEVKVSGPAKVKRGKKAIYTVAVSNSGNAAASGVRLRVSGRGVSFNTSVGKIGSKKTRTLKIRLQAKKPGKVKVSFKVTSKNAGGKATKKTITVRK
jgi:hypothetical protein